MEPPARTDSESMRDEKVKVLKSIPPIEAKDLVRGQFRGYRQEPGVAPGSTRETFAGLRLEIDSWRWAGVPFFIRAGKCLPVTATEVIVELHGPPREIFDETTGQPANYVRFRLGPDRVAIALGVRTKSPGTALVGHRVELYCCNEQGEMMDAYERLISDAIRGDGTLFAREDAVEAAWQIVDPALQPSNPVQLYEAGSWGPPQADAIVASVGGWRAPLPV